MHVLFLPSWYPRDPQDAGGSFFREQAIAVEAQGAQVGVLAVSLESLRKFNLKPTRYARVEAENDDGVSTVRLSRYNWVPRFPRIASIRHASLTDTLFQSYVADFGKPDIIHVHAALPAGLAALQLSKRDQIPYVYSEHSSAFARGMVGRSSVRMVRECALNASRSFAVSTPFARLLDEYLGLAPGFLDVMPNSVDSRFLGTEMADPVDGLTRFVHLSTLATNKNVPILLRSFAQAFGGNSSFQLTIGGHGPNFRSLRMLSSELGLAGQVEFLGALSREAVPSLLANADVFVLPSRVETFGVVLVEALAMGLPVVATKSGGPEDIVGPGDGFLVPVDDVSALTGALIASAQPDDLPTRLARRERCRLRFGNDVVASRWLDIYSRYARCDRSA